MRGSIAKHGLTRRHALVGIGAVAAGLSGKIPLARAAAAAPITIVINQSPWFDSFRKTVELYEKQTGNKVELDVNRKAVLRASGLKALHDEEAIYEAEVALLRARGERLRHDWYAFTVAFKGVFLEGLEVAFIVVTFGGTQRNVGLAALGALAALVVVLIVGSIVHAPLTRVPENTLKFGVGVMLTSFGIFWSSEGAGIKWPGSDAALLAVIAFVVVVSFGLVAYVRQVRNSLEATPS